MRYAHWRDVPPGAWRWRSFAPAEIASRGDGSLVVVAGALDRLQALRDALGAPLVVLSGYRDPIHNARVGGAPLSRHKLGDAFDLALGRHAPRALAALAGEAGFTGFGYYRNFIHLDCGPPRSWYGPGGRTAWKLFLG